MVEKECDDDAYRCPECYSREIVKKDKSKRTVLDADSDGPFSVTYQRQRYRCKRCGKTFTGGSDPYPEKIHATKNFGGYVAGEILNDPKLTLKDAAACYGISTAYISSALHDYVDGFSTLIRTYQECYQLFFYPFVYERKLRCCVCGTSESEDNFLLSILPDYSDGTIGDFIVNHYRHRSGIDAAFCRFDEAVVRFLHDYYLEATIAILYQAMFDEIAKYQADDYDGLFSLKADQLNSLKEIYRQSTSNSLNERLDLWEKNVPEQLKGILSPLIDLNKRFRTELSNSMDYDNEEMDFDRIDRLIRRFKKNGVPYDIMVFRLLYLNQDFRRQLRRTSDMTETGSFSFVTKKIPTTLSSGIDKYGINLDSLFEELGV